MAQRRTTLSQVAALAGVSTATVNRVIDRSPAVSAETREKVRAVLEQTGYRPNSLARSVRTRRTYTIGHVITSIRANPFFVGVAHSVQNAAQVAGYRTMLFNHSGLPERERRGVESFIDQRVDAVLFCTATTRHHIQLVRQAGIPVVEIERSCDASVPFVRIDNHVGATAAMEHLVRLGHRRIAFIGGDPATYIRDATRQRSVEDDRFDAYRSALARHEIPVDNALVRLGEYYRVPGRGEGAIGYQNTRELLELPSRPTAIFATCDILAAGVLQAIAEAGLSVPDDISVIGFDDTLAFNLTPPLTTVSQPTEEIGQVAVRIALALIEGEKVASETVLPSVLIQRKSTGQCRE